MFERYMVTITFYKACIILTLVWYTLNTLVMVTPICSMYFWYPGEHQAIEFIRKV